VWSAVCAVADDATSLEHALSAGALGYEVTTRFATALGPAHRRYWHATATAGIVGAAAGASRALGGSWQETVAAVGHAASVAGGSIQAIVERSGTRFFHRAHAAAAGVAAARVARAGGAPATRYGLEGDGGVLAALSGDSDSELLLAERVEPAIATTGIRLHAASGFAHGAAEAAATLGSVRPESISEVRITISAGAAALASNPHPLDDEQAWWSVEHTVAACLAAGDVSVLERGLSADPSVRDLAGRVAVETGDVGWGAVVALRRTDGEEQTAVSDVPLGHPERPAGEEELLAKWRRLTASDGSALLETLCSPSSSLEDVLDQALGHRRAELFP